MDMVAEMMPIKQTTRIKCRLIVFLLEKYQDNNRRLQKVSAGTEQSFCLLIQCYKPQ